MGSLMHWEILDENRIHVLSALLKSAELGEFYMAGGTALSLEMGLRKSEDFDFFVPHGFYPGDLYRQLTNLFTADNVCEDEISKGTCIAGINGVKVSFFEYPYPTLFNVEMQVSSRPALGRRARYYSSAIDMEALVRGRNYTELPDSYIIFLCDFDPFGQSRYRYTFGNLCREDESVRLGDGTSIVFLSTAGTNRSEVPDEVVELLDYIRTGEMAVPAGSLTAHLQTAVEKVKSSRDMEGRFMVFREMLQDEHEEGRKEGLDEGRREGLDEGRREGSIRTYHSMLVSLLETKGLVSEKLRSRIEAQTDSEVLDRWVRLTSSVQSVEEFCARITQ